MVIAHTNFYLLKIRVTLQLLSISYKIYLNTECGLVVKNFHNTKSALVPACLLARKYFPHLY
jgi:hypothetical protein